MQDHSVADQEAEILAWCAKQQVQLVQVFKDEGISGSEIDRPGLNGLREFLEATPLKGTVVVWKRDRLVRPEDPLDGLLLEREIRSRGWKLHYLTGTNAIGNSLVDAILGLVEHHAGGEYLRKLAQDSLRGQLRRVLAGDVPGCKIPYGYAKVVLDAHGRVVRTIARNQKHRKASGEITRLAPGDPAEVETVQWLFQSYAAGQRSLPALAGELNARKVPAPGSKLWRVGTIRELLVNPVYAGDLTWNKETTARFFRLKQGELSAQDQVHKSRTTGKQTYYQPNAEDQWVRLPGHHHPLIERETFEAVAKMLKERADGRLSNGGQGGRWSDRCYTLTGLVFCANCGHRMMAIPTKARGKVYRRYLCSGFQQARVCRPYWVAADMLERAVAKSLAGHLRLGAVEAALLRPHLRDAIERKACGPNPGLDLDGMTRERGKLQRQIEQSLENLALVPAAVAASLGEKVAGWQDRVAEIDRHLALARERKMQAADVERAADEALGVATQLERVLGGVPREEARAFFVRAVDRIELRFETDAPRPGGKRSKHRFVDGVIKTNADVAVLAEAAAAVVTLDAPERKEGTRVTCPFFSSGPGHLCHVTLL